MIGFTNLFTDGNAYERMMGRWSRLVGTQFLEWLALPNGLRWLDVGCGNGAFTEEIIARCGPKVVAGIDPSPEQVAYARNRPGTSMADFREGGAQALPFDDAAYDDAIMALVISFVPDPAEALAEMARVVKPGGAVATYMWDFELGGAPVHPILEGLQTLGLPLIVPPNAAASRTDALRALWERAGLASIESRTFRIRVEFSSFEDFWQTNSVPQGPQGKAIEKLSPAEKERLREQLRRQLPLGVDGRIAYESVANAIKGRVPVRS